MDDSSVTCSDAIPASIAVTSLLGIKGPLRFRPHGSTQKPHIILRRVNISDDSSDDGQVSHVVRFSLFAHKRIEVKPGKEILLTVASEDPRFENQCLVLEGDELGASDTPGGDEDIVVSKKEEAVPSLGGAIPPKMRRAWTKKNGEGNNAIPTPEKLPPPRSSIGVQAEPAYSSISTQAEPSLESVSSQTENLSVSASVQVDPPLPLVQNPVISTLQAVTPNPSSPLLHQLDTRNLNDKQEDERERSGSPMELDSSHPTPEHSPTMVPDMIEQLSLSPQETLTPLSLPSGSSTQDNSPSSNISLPTTIGEHRDSSNKPIDAPIKVEPSFTPQIPPLPPTAGPSKGKQSVSNPFVSAGFVTSFVGVSDEPPLDTSSPKPLKKEEVEVLAACPGPLSRSRSTSLVLNRSEDPSPLSASRGSSRFGPTANGGAPNAVASSSRLASEVKEAPKTILEGKVPSPAIPSLPRALSSLSSRAREKLPMALPPIPILAPVKTESPPPDARSLASTLAIPSVPAALTHPLPPKPALPQGGSTRGSKRGRPMSPDSPIRRRKRTFRWPTVDSNYSICLKGEGELGVRHIAFNSDGKYFALSCADRTIRIWNNRERTEIARLSHNASILSVCWMDGDAGVVSLGEDGLVSKWTRSGQNHWQWAKVLDAGQERCSDDDQVCMAYTMDRIAISFPRSGVKVWVWSKGTWQAQRSILRQNVSALRFIEEGAALVGGTRDGVLWYCEVPNGTLRAYAFLKSKINSLDLSPTGSHVLVGQVGGCARLVGLRQPDNKGLVEQSYSCQETEARPNGGFGAVFATHGQAVLFGSVEGCVLVWDRKKGAIVYALEHDEDDLIQAVASFDGAANRDGCLITGTKSGHLAWWSQPVSASNSKPENTPKRVKHE